jgi:hypothetical protein
MCCLTIHKIKNAHWVITHNRDELKSRQHLSNEVTPMLVEDKKVWMPIDKQAQGTWIATDGVVAAALLNGYKQNYTRKPQYKASRGCIIPTVFQYTNMEVFVDKFDPTGYEPFTLVIVDPMRGIVEYGWDEYEVHINILSTDQSHMYSSSTLYDDEVKSKRSVLYQDWISNDCDENDLWYLHALKGGDHSHFLNVDYDDKISTVAISQIILGENPRFHYHSLTNMLKETFYLDGHSSELNPKASLPQTKR